MTESLLQLYAVAESSTSLQPSKRLSAPAESWSVAPIQVLSHWSACLPQSLLSAPWKGNISATFAPLTLVQTPTRAGVWIQQQLEGNKIRLPPSLLPAQEGWSTVVDARRVSVMARWEPPAAGPALLGLAFGSALDPSVFPTPPLFWWFCCNCVRTPATDISWECCLLWFTALHWNSTRAQHIHVLSTLQKPSYSHSDNGIKDTQQNAHKKYKRVSVGHKVQRNDLRLAPHCSEEVALYLQPAH